jgi:radical SAM protein with 4Fe4S-binding SPASM domain
MNCNIWKIKSKDELSIDEIEKFFRNYDFNWMTLTGGELFLRKDLRKIFNTITEFNKDLYMITLTTNGYLEEKIVDDVLHLSKKNIPFIMVTVSLDGKKELHNKLRGIDKAYEKAIHTYKRIREIPDIKAQIGYTIYPENAGNLEDFVKHMQELFPDFSVNDIHINTYNTSSHYYGNNTDKKLHKDKYNDLAKKDVRYFLKNFKTRLHLSSIAEKIFQVLSKEYIDNEITPLPCKSLSSSVFLDPYGNIFPCIIWDKKLGNIRDFDYDIKNIFRLEQYKSYLNLIKQRKCPHCWTACEGTHSMLGNLSHPKFLRNLL